MSNSLIDKLIESLPTVGERDYWFIRTYGGDSFEYCYEKSVVSIGWNGISISDLVSLPSVQVKERIKKKYYNSAGLKENTKSRKVGSAYSKLIKFVELKKGDVVIIPSNNSDQLAFGVIADERASNASVDELVGNTDIKRRKVIWKALKNIDALDSIFWKVKSNMHSLSSVNSYSDFIDAVMDEMFIKESTMHQIIDIRKKGDINFNELMDLLNLHKEILLDINNKYCLGERKEIEETFIKLSLNSPGLINLGTPQGRTAAMFGFLMMFTSCDDKTKFGELGELGNGVDQELKDKMTTYNGLKEKLDSTNNSVKYFAN